MHCQFSFLTLPSQMGRKGQLTWQSASKKSRSGWTVSHEELLAAMRRPKQLQPAEQHVPWAPWRSSQLTPGQAIPGAAAWEAQQWSHPPADPAPVWFCFADLSDAQHLMQTPHPGEGFQLFFPKPTPEIPAWQALRPAVLEPAHGTLPELKGPREGCTVALNCTKHQAETTPEHRDTQTMWKFHLHERHRHDSPPLAWSTPSNEWGTPVSEADLQQSP